MADIKNNEIEVFRAGKQTDSAGNSRNWTVEDLDEIVNLYNNRNPNETETAPVVIGHPETDAPAYGWVTSLRRDGDVLIATLQDVAPEFAEMVKAGRYKNRSIALYDNGLLRHVGFLGAELPAVKGLKPVQFSNSKETLKIYFYSENKLINKTKERTNMEDESNLIKISLDDFLKKIVGFAKESISLEAGDLLQTEIAKYTITTTPEKTAEDPEPDTNTQDPADDEFKEKKKKEQELQKCFAESAEYKSMLAKISVLERENRNKDIDAYIAGQIGSHRVMPAQSQLIKNAFSALDNSKTLEFAEARTKSDDALKKLIESFPTQEKMFSEFATNGGLPNELEEIKKFAQERNKK